MTQTQSNDSLVKEKLGTLMRKYTVPCIISLLVAALYNIVDQIFIANASYLGSYGNSANTVVYPLTVIALAIAVTFGDGTGAFFSICMGSRRNETARKSVGCAVLCSGGFGILLLILYLSLKNQILTMFGATVNAETFRLSGEYLFWIAIGIPFYMVGQTLTPIISADGSPAYSMASMLTGAFLNIVLDPIFIYVFKWGMAGAAIATIIGQIVGCVLTVSYLFRTKSVKMSRDCFKIRRSLVSRIVPLGMTSFFAQISIVLSMMAVLNMTAKCSAADEIFSQAEYSQIPTAVIGIVMKFFQIVISVSIGLSAGSIPIIGYNLGAERADRVRGVMKRLLVAEVVVGAVSFAVFELLPDKLVALFGAANESGYYRDFAILCIRAQLSMIVLSCVNKGATIFMQAMGKAKASTGVSVLREIIFGVGFPILFALLFGLYGIPFFMPAADILTFIVIAVLLIKTSSQLKRACPKKEESVKAERTGTLKTSVGSMKKPQPAKVRLPPRR